MSCKGQVGWSFLPPLSSINRGTQFQGKRDTKVKAGLNGAVRGKERTMWVTPLVSLEPLNPGAPLNFPVS